jgi:hypothetical protein
MPFLPESAVVASDLSRSLVAEVAALPKFVFNLPNDPKPSDISDACWQLNFTINTVTSFYVRTKDTLTSVKRMQQLSKCPGDRAVYQDVVLSLKDAVSQANDRIEMLKIQKSSLTLALDCCKLRISSQATSPITKNQ